jgi:signal transduction histidine kinase/CheY-like chemotaxis protein
MDKKDELRQKAEKLLETQGVRDKDLFKKDLKTLIEEISIYQFEIDHQNDELHKQQIELQASKDDFEDLFESAPVGYCVIDKEFIIQKINSMAYAILEIDQKIKSEQSFTKYILPDDQDTFYLFGQSVFLSDNLETSEIRIKSPKNKPKFVKIFAKRRYCNVHESYHIRLAIVDITESVLLEASLKKEKQKADENLRLKSAFLANMSHEIRTPMNSILGFSEILANEEHTPEARHEFAETILTAGNQLMKIINDILDVSKIEANQLSVSKLPVNLTDLIVSVLKIFENHRLLINKPYLKIVKQLDYNERNFVIYTDADRLRQVLQNLIENALKFTEKGTISVGFKMISSNEAEIFVSDTGVGIKPDQQSIIFEQFGQSDSNSFHEGTGLGLSISKSIVSLLGGELKLESELGKGSRFFFRLESNSMDATEISISADGLVPSLSGKRVIIAEDDETSYVYLNKLIKDMGAETLWVANGAELIHEVNKSAPDLVLLDINMPLKTGFDCLVYMKAKQINSKIIVQTAYAMNEEKQKFLNAGADGYVSKPIKRQVLYQEISRVMGGN